MSTIVITGAGGPAGRSLAAQLHQRGLSTGESHTVIGLDVRELDDPHLTASLEVPGVDHPDYLPALRALLGLWRADLLIPTVSEELAQIAALKQALTARQLPLYAPEYAHSRRRLSLPRRASQAGPTGVVVGESAPVTICADKLMTMWALDAAGVAVPRYAGAESFGSTAEALAAMGGSLVTKPRVSRGGRGVRVVEQSSDLDWSELPSGTIVQRFAPGDEYCPQVFRSRSGYTRSVVVLAKTGMAEGRVGNATTVQRLDNAVHAQAGQVAHVAAEAVEALGLTGPVDLDIRIDEDGRAVVLEVNARFGANSAHAPELLTAVLEEYLEPAG